MQYISTRGDRSEQRASEAIIKGLADDKGLYVPKEFPVLPMSVESLTGKSYKEIAFLVLSQFLRDFSEDELKHCIESAYDEKFSVENMVKIENFDKFGVLELYHGKTAAFKDMALSILPYFMQTAMKKEKEANKLCILTATSGDTGKAALEGFADVENTEIAVFFPLKGVSEVQRLQMVTQEGKNTHVFSIEGNFDDAQTGVKAIFSDAEIARKLAEKGVKLSSANSINIGRLLPQIVYYVFTYVKLLEESKIKEGEEINYVVPTGNFGNILAAYYAKRMGTPIKKLICASNENDVLTEFFKTFNYDIREEKRQFKLTNSPSMDILASSNLERLLYHLCDENGEYIKSLMSDLEKKKYYTVKEEYRKNFRDFYGGFANKEETLEAIRALYEKYGYLVDTHTAVAYKVYSDYVKESGDESFTIIASTASPYKFAGSVAKAMGIKEEKDEFSYLDSVSQKTGVAIPKGLQGLKEKKILHNQNLKISAMKSAVQNLF